MFFPSPVSSPALFVRLYWRSDPSRCSPLIMFDSPPALPRLTSPCVIPLSALCFCLALITPPLHHGGVMELTQARHPARHEAILSFFSQHSPVLWPQLPSRLQFAFCPHDMESCESSCEALCFGFWCSVLILHSQWFGPARVPPMPEVGLVPSDCPQTCWSG